MIDNIDEPLAFGSGPELCVTLIVPVLNERSYVRRCVESLIGQDYPSEQTQILIFDGMSRDGTREIVDEFAARFSNIRVLENDRRKKWIAVNDGIKAARGDIVMIVDAHAFYERDYVSQCVHHLLETGAGNVGGPAIARSLDSYQGQAIGLAHQSKFGIGVARFRQSSYEGYADTVWPGAFWRGIAAEVGPFREELDRNQDIEWNTRLRRLGYSIFVTPKIRASYYSRSSIRGLWSQYFANGRSVSQTIFVNWKAIRLRHAIPLLFLVTTVACVAVALVSRFGIIALAAIAASYLSLSVLFSAWAALKNGPKFLPIMPVVFWTIHFSYGLGSLWGLLEHGVVKRWIK